MGTCSCHEPAPDATQPLCEKWTERIMDEFFNEAWLWLWRGC